MKLKMFVNHIMLKVIFCQMVACRASTENLQQNSSTTEAVF